MRESSKIYLASQWDEIQSFNLNFLWFSGGWQQLESSPNNIQPGQIYSKNMLQTASYSCIKVINLREFVYEYAKLDCATFLSF